MSMRHKVTINVAKPDGSRVPVIQSTVQTIRSRVLDLLLGKTVSLLVVTPGDSVETIEVKECKEGG